MPSTCSDVLMVAISRISLLRLGLPPPPPPLGLGLGLPTAVAPAVLVEEVRLTLLPRAVDAVRVLTAEEEEEDKDVCERDGRHFSEPARSTRLITDRFRTCQIQLVNMY